MHAWPVHPTPAHPALHHVTRSDQAQRLQLREARDVVLGVV